jgi:glycolate oxidase
MDKAYGKITQKIVDELAGVAGEGGVLSGDAVDSYLYDEVELTFRPEAAKGCVVVRPGSTEEVAAVMKIADRERIPVVVRGGGTGLTGACTPELQSIILSMERMNRICGIDEENMAAELEAGVTLMDLLDELDRHDGLSFPVHPGDEGAEIGGMVVTNAGGARAVRHGVMRKHILGLEAVLPDGRVLELGGRLLKDNAGYDLKQFFIGSEGTLGVVTKVLLRLYPQEKYQATIVAPFPKIEDACSAVMDIVRSGDPPLAVEYMDKKLFTGTAEMLGTEWQAKEGDADIIIILSEKTEERLFEAVRSVNDICEKHGSFDCLFAGRPEEQKEILDIRSQHYELIRDRICDSFDMCVPVASVPEFITGLKDIAHSFGTDTNIVGHIADGNVHNDIMYDEDGNIPPYAAKMKQNMYILCDSLGGTFTGEHGVGKIRRGELERFRGPAEMEMMHGIKKVFDPKMIMNPGNIFEN